ncbi:MAG: hypothetical protein NC394_01390 [Bacteroides sp.]|nr:hypothetical protein [Bacteroides sp.]
MIKSYRIFIVKEFTKKQLLYSLVLFVITVLSGLCGSLVPDGTLKNLANTLLPVFCVCLFPICSLTSMAQIYNANLADQPWGYKYFHSLKNSAKHFKRAIIFGNLLSLAVSAPVAAALMLLFPADRIILMVAFSFFALGIMNFFGHLRSATARAVPLAVLGGCLGGFYFGAEMYFSRLAVTIASAIAAAVYIGGFVFTAAGAETAWNRDGGKKEKMSEKKEKNAPADSETRSVKKRKKPSAHSSAALLMSSVSRSSKAAVIAVTVLSAVMTVLPFLVHEATGGGDYMFPKLFIFTPGVFLAEFAVIIFYRDWDGNKFARSIPAAKTLYCRSLPAAISLLTAGTSTLLTGCYFVFLGLIHAELTHYSDTLIIGAVIIGGVLLAVPITVSSPVGGVFTVYAAALPIIALIWLTGEEARHFGFGVPLYISVVIFILTAALGTAWAFYICRRRYMKRDVRLYPTVGVGR